MYCPLLRFGLQLIIQFQNSRAEGLNESKHLQSKLKLQTDRIKSIFNEISSYIVEYKQSEKQANLESAT